MGSPIFLRWMSHLESRSKEGDEEGSRDDCGDEIVGDHKPPADLCRGDLLKAKLNCQDSWIESSSDWLLAPPGIPVTKVSLKVGEALSDTYWETDFCPPSSKDHPLYGPGVLPFLPVGGVGEALPHPLEKRIRSLLLLGEGGKTYPTPPTPPHPTKLSHMRERTHSQWVITTS